MPFLANIEHCPKFLEHALHCNFWFIKDPDSIFGRTVPIANYIYEKSYDCLSKYGCFLQNFWGHVHKYQTHLCISKKLFVNNICVPELFLLTEKETAALPTPNFHSWKNWGEFGKSDLVGYGIAIRIGRFPVQTPLGTQPGLEAQSHYEVPGDLQV